jgi:hypothetical protein
MTLYQTFLTSEISNKENVLNSPIKSQPLLPKQKPTPLCRLTQSEISSPSSHRFCNDDSSNHSFSPKKISSKSPISSSIPNGHNLPFETSPSLYSKSNSLLSWDVYGFDINEQRSTPVDPCIE